MRKHREDERVERAKIDNKRRAEIAKLASERKLYIILGAVAVTLGAPLLMRMIDNLLRVCKSVMTQISRPTSNDDACLNNQRTRVSAQVHADLPALLDRAFRAYQVRAVADLPTDAKDFISAQSACRAALLPMSPSF